MKSIHTEQELITFIKIATGIEMSGDEPSYFEAMEWLNNLKRGYNIISSVESALFWLKDGKYTISNFIGGVGLLDKNRGGCYGYFADGLLEKMAEDELIYYNPQTTQYGGIKAKGFALLGKE